MYNANHFIYYGDDAITKIEIEKRFIFSNKVSVSLIDTTSNVFAQHNSMWFKGINQVINQSDTSLKGPHNLINTMQAVSAALIAGVEMKSIKNSLITFINAPHRLESVAIINGVEYVNDSKATNVDSVVYALGSYSQKLVWIAGGIDKGNDYSLIMDQVKDKVRVLICLGKDNEKLKSAFSGVVENVLEMQSITELIQQANAIAKEGEVVLLSPACASFDLFKNYEDRGDQFRKAVLELKLSKQIA